MAALVKQCEHSILTGLKINGNKTEFPDFIKWFLEGQYEKVLDSSSVSESVLRKGNEESLKTFVFCNFLQQNVEAVLTEQCENVELRDIHLLLVAVSCLQLYIQNNWLGPFTTKSPLQFCHKFYHDKVKVIESEAQDELSVDGEIVYSKSQHLIYLFIARVILLEFRSKFVHIQTWDWWLLRCLCIQQELLSERSSTLKTIIFELIDDLSKREPLITDDTHKNIQIMFHVEAGHASHTYFEYRKAAEHFHTAKKVAGIQVQLTGKMGKRTHFQTEDTAQLVLEVEKEKMEEETEYTSAEITELPKNLPLDDDTVLNEIKFTDDSALTAPNLSPFEEALIIGLMESYRRNRARERLTDEEVLTYLSFILNHARNWSVTVVALNLRSKLERDSRRRVERSMMQLEELVKTVSNPKTPPDVGCRIPLFYASHVPSLWTVQKDLASLLMSLGCFGDALDVFEKLEMWEDVISCYQRLGKLEKAEAVIREQLAIKETPALFCFLGDVTRDRQHYQHAWELSGCKSARAMRCLGYVHFQEENYDKAIECFAASLNISSMQIPVWFTYGCAAMACQKFDLGIKAFRRCVSIDYDNFEAWSNLATCYVRLQQKRKAYDTLQDAIKCNYENWRLWENSLIIGTDCGEFEDVIRSYHRLMDLKDKWIDIEVLKILTRAVLEKIPDANGNPADHLGDKLLELFGRITSKVTTEGEIWSNYAKLSNNKVGSKEPDPEKAFQYLQKAYRCYTQKVDWEKDIKTCKKISEESISLGKVYCQCAEGKPTDESVRLLSGAKLMLKGALVKIQKQHTDPVTGELPSDVTDISQKLESALSDIISQIEALKS